MVNRRMSARLGLNCPIEIKKPGDAAYAVPANTEDLSIGGLSFRSKADLRPGEMLDILIDLGGADRVSMASEVMWTRDNGAGKLVGVKFNKMQHRDMVKVMGAMLLNKA